MTRQRVALVTGAGNGIGRASALALADRFHRVAVTDIDDAAAQRTVHAITEAGGSAVAIALDVADDTSRRAAVSRCVSELGGLDLLVNCAGVLRDARIEKLEDSLFESMLEVNLIGPLALIHTALPHLRAAGTASVVNVASRAWLGTFGSTAYSGAKGGLVGASRSLALELAPDGITVNCVAPGFIETDMTSTLPPKIRERILAAIPIGRPGHPADVAAAVVFFASNGYCTGQTLLMCGGRGIGQPIAEAS
ncbi:SDR family NAD(P)-dependent oxidoreductase [Streptomyces rhizosphaericus]|uniref:SDR family oxidoreductase n=1 Tax=Streptomyces rhizosphaericus TaxID=114699 RepID=A0A6G4AJG7_9ACTN|nr:SDR family NAD(P)-dependent oxidoreductase [Streptomyces rhizosphaericus]NEW72944.1 SDR family oxidoreductase [Streptomyces rhizosphaericus]